MKHFLIVKNRDKDKDNAVTRRICDFITKAGGYAEVVERSLDEMRDELKIPESCECVIVLGGDGSILRTERALYPRELPLVGVNLGNLGFLTQTEPEDVTDLLTHLIASDVRIARRMLLKGTIWHDGEPCYEDIALNDIVVGRGGLSRIIRLRITVNDELLGVYDADGVVVSTPTGSTAYNLSAGGPVVCPSTNLIVVTPISPHSLSARSVVLSDSDTLKIKLERARVWTGQAVVTFDGQTGQPIEPDDVIEIARSEHDAHMVREMNVSFYDVLRNKMY